MVKHIKTMLYHRPLPPIKKNIVFMNKLVSTII